MPSADFPDWTQYMVRLVRMSSTCHGPIPSLASRRTADPFLIFLIQWLQAAVGLFYGNLLGRPINLLTKMQGNHQVAVFLLLTGLLVLALSIRLATGPPIRGLYQRVQVFVAARPLRFWLWVFVGAWIFSTVCAAAAWASGGLRQVLLNLASQMGGLHSSHSRNVRHPQSV